MTRPKVVVVMPAYNAERTLERCHEEIPRDSVDEVLLVDDASRDRTVEVARRLGIPTIVHPENRGYGGNQKTCYAEALRRGAGIVVMVHPDHQYPPRVIPELVAPLAAGEADACFGSRMLGGRFFEGGMPRWKFTANVALTATANIALGVYFTEVHSGFRAYTRRYLETVRLDAFSDDFVFDTQIIVAGVLAGMRFREVGIETRYFDEASQIGFRRSCVYGAGILGALGEAVLHRAGLRRSPRFA